MHDGAVTSGERWRLGHRPALDGLRGVAIALVLLEHSGVPVIGAAGVAGVTLFFVLSGFLITSLLIEEHADSGRIDLSRFYARRVRRLLPPLLAMIAIVAVLGMTSGSRWFFDPNESLLVVFYIGNWATAYGADLGALSGTWSLSVEEQFYVAWPLLVIVLLRRGNVRRLMVATVCFMALSVGARLVLLAGGATPREVYARTDTAAAALLAGAALACWLHGRRTPALSRLWAGVGLFGLLMVSTAGWPFKLDWTPVLAASVSVVLVLSAATSPASWLSAAWLRWFGRRSYAMYLFHIPLTRLLRDQTDLPWMVKLVITVAWAAIASEIVWQLVESRFRRRSDRAEVVSGESGRRDVDGRSRGLADGQLHVVAGAQQEVCRVAHTGGLCAAGALNTDVAVWADDGAVDIERELSNSGAAHAEEH